MHNITITFTSEYMQYDQNPAYNAIVLEAVMKYCDDIISAGSFVTLADIKNHLGYPYDSFYDYFEDCKYYTSEPLKYEIDGDNLTVSMEYYHSN